MRIFRHIILVTLILLAQVNITAKAADITSNFGWRVHPVTGEWKFHSGIDIGYEYGTPIVAMLAGKVVYAAEYDGYGNCIILEHPGGDHTLYAHCSSLATAYGAQVGRGDVIAYVGSTGISTGPHLHLEWWHNNQYVDPLGLWSAG